MDEKLKDFKGIADNELKHIFVSEELKRKTLQKCRKTTVQSKKIIIAPIIATATAAMIGMIMALPSFMTSKDEMGLDKYLKTTESQSRQNEYTIDTKLEENVVKTPEAKTEKTNKPKIKSIEVQDLVKPKTNNVDASNNDKREKTGASYDSKDKSSENNKSIKKSTEVAINVPSMDKIKPQITDNKKNAYINDITIDDEKSGEVKDKNLDDKADEKAIIQTMQGEDDINNNGTNKAMLKASLNPTTVSLTEEEAKLQLKDEFKVPSYIPEGFKINQVIIPKVKEQNNNIFEIRYSSSDDFFSVVKITNENAKLDSTEVIKVKGKDLYCIPSGSDDFIILRWNDNNNMYEISGNISREELIKVAESLM